MDVIHDWRLTKVSKLIGRLLAPMALIGLVLVFVGCGGTQAAAEVPHVGFLSVSASPAFVEALQEGLNDLGYVEGVTINIEWRVTEDKAELAGIAQEFVDLEVDLIIAGGTKAIQAAMKATTTIPIVMTNTGDAVGNGLVKSLASPGGNVTGLTQISPAVSGKRVEILKDAIPNLSNIGVLWYTDHPTTPKIFAEIEAAAPSLGLSVLSLEVMEPEDIESAFDAAMEGGVGALITVRDPFTKKHQQTIVDMASERGLPTIYETQNYLDAGGIMLYGPSFEDLYRRSAVYVDKILKGANPAEMPVEQPNTFELVINETAAENIGLVFPESILVRANQVVQ